MLNMLLKFGFQLLSNFWPGFALLRWDSEVHHSVAWLVPSYGRFGEQVLTLGASVQAKLIR